MKTFLKITAILLFFCSIISSVCAQTTTPININSDQLIPRIYYRNYRDYGFEISVEKSVPVTINFDVKVYADFRITTDDGLASYYYYNKRGVINSNLTLISTTGIVKFYFSIEEPIYVPNSLVLTVSKNISSEYLMPNGIYTKGNHIVEGNVGIGVLNPKQKLDIDGNVLIKGNSDINNTVNTIGQNIKSVYTYYSETYGTKIYTANTDGFTYGIYSRVSGAAGKRWAGYFEGGEVAVMNGNVGIGTSTPKALLDVTGVGNWAGGLAVISKNVDPYYGDCLVPFKNSKKMLLGWNYSSGRGEQSFFSNGPANLVGGFSFYNYKDDASIASHLMTIGGDGNVGIGIASPTTKLDVRGEITIGTDQTYSLFATPTAGAAIKMGASSTTWDRNMHLGFIDGNRAFSSVMSLIHENGFVGIGTTKPTHLLSVNGTIRAKEVLVDLCENLADYVFSPDYSLMPLPKVEAFVKQNKHLPEIPSAAEVKEKGLSMGEMQNKLLQKIEELTLYVIEQQKQIEELKAQIVK